MAKRDAMIEGTMPKKGMVLVNKGRDKAYGVIIKVKNDDAGTVIWKSYATGAPVKTDPEYLRMAGCTYQESSIVGKD